MIVQALLVDLISLLDSEFLREDPDFNPLENNDLPYWRFETVVNWFFPG